MKLTRRTLMATLAAFALPLAAPFRALAAAITGTVTGAVNSVKATPPGRPEGTEPVEIAVGDAIETGTVLQTAKQSAVEVTLTDGTAIVIGARGQAVVGGQGFEALAIAKGNFRYRTGSGPDPYRALSTPALAIALKGTEIIVSVDETRTICGVVRGSITCTSKKTGKAIEVAEGQSVAWAAGSFGGGVTEGVFATGDVAVDQGMKAAAEAWKAAPPPPPPRPRPQPPRPKPGRQ